MCATAAWSPGSTMPSQSVLPRERQGNTLKRWARRFGISAAASGGSAFRSAAGTPWARESASTSRSSVT